MAKPDDSARRAPSGLSDLVHAFATPVLAATTDGRIAVVNDAALALLGFDRVALLDAPLAGVRPDAAQLVGSAHVFARHRDGSLLPVNATATVIDDVGGKLRLLSLALADQVLAPERRAGLRREEAARAIADQEAIVVTSIDSVTGRPDLIRYVSAGYTGLTGTAADDLLGKPASALAAAAADGAGHPLADRECWGNLPATVEFPVACRGRRARWVEARVMPLPDSMDPPEAVWILRDITTRRDTEAQLRRSEHLLHGILEAELHDVTTGDSRVAFDQLLRVLLRVTDSEYGFIGEIIDSDGPPFLKVHAWTNIAWNDETRALYAASEANGVEFRNLYSLFGHVIRTHQPVIANDPYNDARRGGLPPGHPPLNKFLGLPFAYKGRIIGMVGVANRPSGYDQTLVQFLAPLLATCAQLIESRRNELRRRAAELRAESEQRRLQALFDGTRDAIILADDRGRCVDANPAACRLFDVPREQLLGTTPADWIPADEQSAAAAMWQRLLTDGALDGQGIVARRDGRRLFVDIRAVANVLPGVHLGVLHDTTERRRAEHTLRRQSLLLEKTQSVGQTGGFELDRMGHLILTSETLRIFGVDPLRSVPTLETFIARFADPGQDLVLEAIDDARQNGTPFDLSVPAHTDEGRLIWLRVAGQVDERGGAGLTVFGVVQDITERHELEHALLEATHREQERLSYDLHDGLGQELTGIGLMIAALKRRVVANSEVDIADFDRVLGAVGDAVTNARQIAHGLSPFASEQGGFATALRALAQRMMRMGAVAVEVAVDDGADQGLDHGVANHLYRIVQEAINNAARHGSATTIRVRIRLQDGQGLLLVTDDGRGLPGAAGPSQGLGLRIMAHRARLIGGTLSIHSIEPSGVRLSCTFRRGPIEPARRTRPG